jgi:eukaryotic-like serine/threonine-protein kinase
MLSTTAPTSLARLSSPFARSFLAQPFRCETGDGGVVITRDGEIYRLESILGVGGLATVYRAVRLRDRKFVALKLASGTNRAGACELVLHEAHILTKLDHPNIVSVIETGETQNGEPYMAMDLLTGVTLDRVLLGSGKTMSLNRAVNICSQTAEGLSHAHCRGIIHRDIKPTNIVINTINGYDYVRIIDFGIAVDGELAADSPGSNCGSLLYVAPEQLIHGQCSPRSDVFSLGLTLFECLAGRLPFEVSLPAALAYRRGDLPLLPEDYELDTPLEPEVRELLLWALSLNPDDRPSSMNLFAHQLKQTALKSRKSSLLTHSNA